MWINRVNYYSMYIIFFEKLTNLKLRKMKIGTIIALAGVARAAMSGGVYAAATALGAIAGQKAVNIMDPVLEYAIFDPEHGYYKDFPDGREDNYAKRIIKIAKGKPEGGDDGDSD